MCSPSFEAEDEACKESFSASQKHYKKAIAKSQECALKRLQFVVCVVMMCSSNCEMRCVDEIGSIQGVNVVDIHDAHGEHNENMTCDGTLRAAVTERASQELNNVNGDDGGHVE